MTQRQCPEAEYIKSVADAVVHRLMEHRRLDNKTHSDHHAFLEMMIKREARRTELIEKFKASFVGAVAIATVSGLAWVGSIIFKALHKI